MATLFPYLQFLALDGKPLSNGRLYWEESGTSTPKLTWKNANETTPHVLAYITLDGNGYAPDGPIYIRGSYKLRILDSALNTIETIDPVTDYDHFDFTGLTATIADLNSTTTNTLLKNATYTIAIADRGKTILADTSAGSFTINLPPTATVGNKFKIIIKKKDLSVNTVNLVPSSPETIDLATTFVLYDCNDMIELQSDGSNWKIVSSLIRGTIANLATTKTLAMEDNGKIFNCNTTTGSFDINLPASVSVGRGYAVSFKKVDHSINEITLKPNGSETIDGRSFFAVNAYGHIISIKTDGLNWYIINEAASVADKAITGDIQFSMLGSPVPAGWISFITDGTIGDSTSGASIRAHNDCVDLFELLWQYPICTVDGGKGGSAPADWAAHRKIHVPPLYDKVIGSGGYIRGAGDLYGEYTHTLTIAEMANHYHALDSNITRITTPRDFNLKQLDDPGKYSDNSTGSTGSSSPHNNEQPTFYVYTRMKL
jgi:hypothetical protein